MGVKEFFKKRSGLRIDNRATTSAATLTLRQSLWPLTLVTILFFLWVRDIVHKIYKRTPSDGILTSAIRVSRMVCWTPSTAISKRRYILTEPVRLVSKQRISGMYFLHTSLI